MTRSPPVATECKLNVNGLLVIGSILWFELCFICRGPELVCHWPCLQRPQSASDAPTRPQTARSGYRAHKKLQNLCLPPILTRGSQPEEGLPWGHDVAPAPQRVLVRRPLLGHLPCEHQSQTFDDQTRTQTRATLPRLRPPAKLKLAYSLEQYLYISILKAKLILAEIHCKGVSLY